MIYLPLGELLPRPVPDGFPVVLGPLFGRGLLFDILFFVLGVFWIEVIEIVPRFYLSVCYLDGEFHYG